MYSFYCSDTTLFLIDYVWSILCNKRLPLFQNNPKSLTLEENVVAVIIQDRAIKTEPKGKLKTELCILVGYSYYPEFFNILAIGQKYFSFYPSSFFNIHT